MNRSTKELSDFRNQAFTAFPFLKLLERLDDDFSTILNTIDNGERLVPVLTQKLSIPRRSLHQLGAHTSTIMKIFGKFQLPSHSIGNTLEFENLDKSEAFIRLLKILSYIAPDHQPENENDYFELIKIMRLIYSYWILAQNMNGPLEQAAMNQSICAWICARAWTHIHRRPLKRSFSIPTVNPFIIRHLRAWSYAVRAQQPGELFIGTLPGKNLPKNLSPLRLYAHQWAIISLLDRHPADLQKLMDDWPNQVRHDLVNNLRKYGHVPIAMEDQFSVGVDSERITLSKITDLGTVLGDSILARNCLADYGHILLKNEVMDVWRIYEGDQKPTTLVGHVMRCHRNGTLLFEANLLGNKPLPPKLSRAIVQELQHRDFDAGPRDSTALYQSIESLSHRSRIQALSGHAKALIDGAVKKFRLEMVLQTDIAQLEEAIEFLPAARKLAQQIVNPRVEFPRLLPNSHSQSNVWGFMKGVLSDNDVPIEIVEGIVSPTEYRKNELLATALSSVCLEFKQKYALLTTPQLTEFQVDALIETLAEGNARLAALCSEKDAIKLNAKACTHLVLLCHIFYNNFNEKGEQILLSRLIASMEKRALQKFSTHEFPSLGQINEFRKSIALYSEDLDMSGNYILDIICNQTSSEA
jgi:hypothetical protein